MEFLDTIVLGNAVRDWLVALGIAAVTYFALRFVAFTAVKRLAAATAKTRITWDDVITDGLKATKGLLIVIVALFAGSTVLELGGRASGLLRSVTIIALLVQGGMWVSAGMTSWLKKRTEAQAEDDPAQVMTMNVIGVAARLVLWSMVLLLSLDNMGIDVTALVAGLGIGGIAVALAAQNILGDLFASVSIVLDKPFVLGDFLSIGDFVGTVEAIGLKTTRVRSLSGEQVVFANTDLLSSRIRNFGRMFQRRVVLTIGVTYQTTRDQLAEVPGIIHEAIGVHGDKVRFDRSHLSSYGDFAIEFESVYLVLDPDYALHMDIKQDVLLKVHEEFEKRGIEYAYPTQTIFVEKAAS